MTYIATILTFGLFQLWVLAGYLKLKEINFTFAELVNDGGLFFFASSLVVTSILNHSKVFSKINKVEITWSFITTIILIVACVVGFVSAINLPEKTSAFQINLNHTQNLLQVICSTIAILYGFILEKRIEKVIKLNP